MMYTRTIPRPELAAEPIGLTVKVPKVSRNKTINTTSTIKAAGKGWVSDRHEQSGI